MKQGQTIAKFLGITQFPYTIKDSEGNEIYREYTNGYWVKYEYKTFGNESKLSYYEEYKGYWVKREYDSEGKLIYIEDSTGVKLDDRPKVIEVTLADIAQKLGVDVKLLRIKE